MRRALAAVAALVVATALTGCKSLENVARGGKVVGDTLTVYSLLPEPGTGNARDFVDAEKLALYGTAAPRATSRSTSCRSTRAGAARWSSATRSPTRRSRR